MMLLTSQLLAVTSVYVMPLANQKCRDVIVQSDSFMAFSAQVIGSKTFSGAMSKSPATSVIEMNENAKGWLSPVLQSSFVAIQIELAALHRIFFMKFDKRGIQRNSKEGKTLYI